MDYEKKYNNALERAKKLYEQGTITESLNYVFPELAESEDEKIRKEIIGIIRNAYWTSNRDRFNKLVAWLEKQESVEEIVARCKNSWYNEGKIAGMAEGLTDDEKYQQGWHDAIEKKEEKVDNANKVEPKFHEGEWIIFNEHHNSVYQVEKIKGLQYYLRHYNGGSMSVYIDSPLIRQWTIADAKDGDVLAFNDGTSGVLLYKENTENFGVLSYCRIIRNSFIDKEESGWGSTLLSPATKEQRDALLKAMTDAGWEFDFEKKELKKIEIHNSDKVESKFYESDWIVDNDDGDFFKVTKVREHTYRITGIGDEFDIQREVLEDNYHKFTIQDAKDGDVLVSDNIVFIFNKIHDIWIKCHCSLYEDGSFYGGDFDLMHIKYGKEVFPATKEQHDTLMKAMVATGYTFDFENKELKKIEPKFKVKYAGSEYNVLEIKEIAGVTFYGIEDEPNHIDYVLPENCEIISGYAIKENGSFYPTKPAVFSEQNPAWSEEDGKKISKTI